MRSLLYLSIIILVALPSSLIAQFTSAEEAQISRILSALSKSMPTDQEFEIQSNAIIELRGLLEGGEPRSVLVGKEVISRGWNSGNTSLRLNTLSVLDFPSEFNEDFLLMILHTCNDRLLNLEASGKLMNQALDGAEFLEFITAAHCLDERIESQQPDQQFDLGVNLEGDWLRAACNALGPSSYTIIKQFAATFSGDPYGEASCSSISPEHTCGDWDLVLLATRHFSGFEEVFQKFSALNFSIEKFGTSSIYQLASALQLFREDLTVNALASQRADQLLLVCSTGVQNVTLDVRERTFLIESSLRVAHFSQAHYQTALHLVDQTQALWIGSRNEDLIREELAALRTRWPAPQ